ncbi:hypothetical protein [Paraglaciecola arctica]|uniref:hypothetical protein n=1 Tax=Paraglaciecola arctica TaxID=1128911 RepID=UPI001C07AA02|nr:hypothetical protein [Paraglaciecola arctica]MBU3002059.1 hypothetical protein [Paraglaciecola arctica]
MKHANEHGEYVVDRSRQTIMFSARGPWNDETMKRGAKEMGDYIAQLNLSKPWGTLSCLYGESLMPPSTYQSFLKHTLIRKSMGLKALAVVIRDSEIANTIKSQLVPAYEEADLKFAFLSDVNSACTWLSEVNVELDKQQVEQFFTKNAFIHPNR